MGKLKDNNVHNIQTVDAVMEVREPTINVWYSGVKYLNGNLSSPQQGMTACYLGNGNWHSNVLGQEFDMYEYDYLQEHPRDFAKLVPQ